MTRPTSRAKSVTIAVAPAPRAASHRSSDCSRETDLKSGCGPTRYAMPVSASSASLRPQVRARHDESPMATLQITAQGEGNKDAILKAHDLRRRRGHVDCWNFTTIISRSGCRQIRPNLPVVPGQSRVRMASRPARRRSALRLPEPTRSWHLTASVSACPALPCRPTA
jgi:hypothetical protein